MLLISRCTVTWLPSGLLSVFSFTSAATAVITVEESAFCPLDLFYRLTWATTLLEPEALELPWAWATLYATGKFKLAFILKGSSTSLEACRRFYPFLILLLLLALACLLL